MNDVERALSQISLIHERMAASTQFRGFAPAAVALTGLLALAVATAQTAWPEALALDPLRYVAVWVATAVVATGVIAGEAVARSHRLHGRMASAMIFDTLWRFLPFGAAGAVVTFVVCQVSPATAWALPGLWQILISLLVFAALPSLPGSIVWAAGSYFVCGAVVLACAGRDGILSPWMMGVPFAVGQGLIALVLYFPGADFHGRR